jgi:hypothetical protein
MRNITYQEWLINQKRLPDKKSEEYAPFFEFHKELMLDGFMMDGVYINPFLYWHLNAWHTEVDMMDEKGRIYQKYANPSLRDNEWIITEAITKAQEERKGLVILGLRRLGKSVIEASYIGWGATFDENSQNIIAGLNAPDIKLITDKLDKGLNFLPEYFRWQRVEDNWKNQVTLGIKTRAGERIPFSQILIRNLDEGNNEEAIAGTKPRKLIIDEALHEDSILYYEDGCKKIKDCQIGDRIYGADGKLTTILDKINPGVVDTYKITLLDGREIIASGNHLWKVWNVYRKKWMVLTTDELREKYYFEKRDERYDKSIKSFIYSLPINNPVEYTEKNLPIDPYYLGLWLGDGTSENTNICSIDEEIIQYCKEYAERIGLNSTIIENVKDKSKEFKRVFIVNKKGLLNPLREKLKELNVFKNKHIPDIYLYSSLEQRYELLRGLMDTDGSCDKSGHIEFGTSISKLASTFSDLCRSLGIAFKVNIVNKTYSYKGEKKKGRDHWRFQLSTENKNIFKLERKKAFIKVSDNVKKKAYRERVSISNIEYVGKNQVYCIKVDNEDHLFLTDNFIVTHNCGKGNFLRGLQAAIPGFTTPFGWGCSPILTGTGGDMKRFMDAKSLMFDVKNYNFLDYTNEDNDRRVHGLFISNKYRMEAKEPSTLAAFLDKPQSSDLNNVSILVSNEQEAERIITDNLERLKKAGDRSAYLKEKMYYPQKVDDIFLNEDTNIFDIEGAKRQKTRLLNSERTGVPVMLHSDEGRVYHEFTDKMPITNFPLKPTDRKDAPVVVYEFPIENPPYGLYVAGVDSYRQGQAKYSTSLGSVYIYKRMHDISGEKYQDMFVASYCARPDKKEHWEEQARLLIKYYNARALVENDDMSFIEYMKSKGDSHYLEKQPGWLKEVIPNTTVNRDFGIHRSAQKIIDYLHSCLKKYTEETIHIEKNDEGIITREVTGMSKIFDPMLLEEMIQYNEEGNFDRIVAAELAIAQAMKMDPIFGKAGASSDARVKSLYSRKNKPSKLFSNSANLFTNRKNKLFT